MYSYLSGSINDLFGDVWVLDISERSHVTIQLNSTKESDLDPYLTLYSPNFQIIAENNDSLSDVLMPIPDSILEDIDLTESGRYFISASRYCPNNDRYTTGDYVLYVTVTEIEETATATATPAPTPIALSPLAVPTPHVLSPLATPIPHVDSPLVMPTLQTEDIITGNHSSP